MRRAGIAWNRLIDAREWKQTRDAGGRVATHAKVCVASDAHEANARAVMNDVTRAARIAETVVRRIESKRASGGE